MIPGGTGGMNCSRPAASSLSMAERWRQHGFGARDMEAGGGIGIFLKLLGVLIVVRMGHCAARAAILIVSTVLAAGCDEPSTATAPTPPPASSAATHPSSPLPAHAPSTPD